MVSTLLKLDTDGETTPRKWRVSSPKNSNFNPSIKVRLSRRLPAKNTTGHSNPQDYYAHSSSRFQNENPLPVFARELHCPSCTVAFRSYDSTLQKDNEK
ncbi:hypothetical protein AVEN_62801-1 [Araneus ventricosus]|uniref:Uncharacterized protein n=1 Tax=Araneus ventricosus TaxID=182803 RepID=A0A4Y2P1B0_ARAVE|nr:hypothetical protein AVEN_62801-1 [Araneus ventricosus]